MLANIDVHTYRRADHPIDVLFLERWSPRAMSGEPVTPAELLRLFEAARWAPSSYNEQPWRLLYARRDTPAWPLFFELLVDANKAWTHRAGVLLLIVSKRTFAHGGQANPVHIYDAGAAWMSLALQAVHEGLVVHGMAGFDRDRAREVLRIPEDFGIGAMAAIGRPGRVADLPTAMQSREVPSGRRPLAETAFEGMFPG